MSIKLKYVKIANRLNSMYDNLREDIDKGERILAFRSKQWQKSEQGIQYNQYIDGLREATCLISRASDILMGNDE